MKKELREKVWNKYNCHCAYCGDEIKYKDMQVDHIIPKSNWDNVMMYKDKISYWNKKVPDFLKYLTSIDLNHIDNLNPSCRVCNKFKDTFSLEMFRSELMEQAKRAFKTNSSYRRALKFNQIKETPREIIFYFETIELSF